MTLCNECPHEATWLIGTGRMPSCDNHHKRWLECFNYKQLQKSSCILAERYKSVGSVLAERDRLKESHARLLAAAKEALQIGIRWQSRAKSLREAIAAAESLETSER